MSDYIYLLESHLSPEQNRVLSDVQAAAAAANVNLFLTGGAMRDMLAGFRIRDLDFVVEGNALKVAKELAERPGARVTATDENRKAAELQFDGDVTVQIAMARQEKYGKPGGRVQVSPSTIQEDLRGRDFTCNAIALSLNKASRGLLLDPMNGLADIERRELRAVSPYGFYDDPTRLLRLARLRVRLGFSVEERTRMQVANAREAETEKQIPRTALAQELRRIGAEDRAGEILSALESEGLLALFSPALAGGKLNEAGLAKFDKAASIVPPEPAWRTGRWGTFLYALAEKLPPREKQTLAKNLELTKADIDAWQKLEARAKKLETALRAPRVRKPSHVYHLMARAAPDEVIFLLYHSPYKPVVERMRNYFQKYLPALQEVTAEEWATVEGQPGTAKYNKARDEFITKRLDRRPPKPADPAAAEAPAPPVVEAAGKRK